MKIRKSGLYYGVKKSEVQNMGFALSEYDYNLPETDWHFHENPYFMFVLQGQLKDLNSKGTRLCPKGSLLFLNWQEAHKNTKESSYARGFHIELDKKWFGKNRLGDGLWEGSKFIKNPSLHHTFIKIYQEFRTNDEFSNLSLDALVLNLCDGLWEETSSKSKMEPNWMRKLEEIIYDNDELLTLDYLSQELGIHPVHLSRSFPKYRDMTFGEFVRMQRVKKSIPLLLDSKHTLTQIAYSCGFSDQSHYTRTFKRYFNTTPLLFRKALR